MRLDSTKAYAMPLIMGPAFDQARRRALAAHVGVFRPDRSRRLR